MKILILSLLMALPVAASASTCDNSLTGIVRTFQSAVGVNEIGPDSEFGDYGYNYANVQAELRQAYQSLGCPLDTAVIYKAGLCLTLRCVYQKGAIRFVR